MSLKVTSVLLFCGEMVSCVSTFQNYNFHFPVYSHMMVLTDVFLDRNTSCQSTGQRLPTGNRTKCEEIILNAQNSERRELINFFTSCVHTELKKAGIDIQKY